MNTRSGRNPDSLLGRLLLRMRMHSRVWNRAGSKRQRPHLVLGRRGEQAAAKFLQRAGYRIIARNLDTPGGEADLVCVKARDTMLVLVEVKSRIRAANSHTPPTTASINAKKRARLVNTARAIKGKPEFHTRPIRIDVITVEYQSVQDPSPQIKHFVSAVSGRGRLGR